MPLYPRTVADCSPLTDPRYFIVRLLRNSRAGAKGGEQGGSESALGSTLLQNPPACQRTGLDAQQQQQTGICAAFFKAWP